MVTSKPPAEPVAVGNRLVAMRSTAQIRQAIAHIVPGFEQIGRHRSHETRIPNRRPHVPRRRNSPRPTAAPDLHTHDLPESARHGRRRNPPDDASAAKASSTRSSTKTKTSTAASTAATSSCSTPTTSAACGLSDGERVTIHGPAGSMHEHPRHGIPKHQTRQRRDVLPRVQRPRQPHVRSAKQNAGVQMRDRARHTVRRSLRVPIIQPKVSRDNCLVWFCRSEAVWTNSLR